MTAWYWDKNRHNYKGVRNTFVEKSIQQMVLLMLYKQQKTNHPCLSLCQKSSQNGPYFKAQNTETSRGKHRANIANYRQEISANVYVCIHSLSLSLSLSKYMCIYMKILNIKNYSSQQINITDSSQKNTNGQKNKSVAIKATLIFHLL